MLATAPFESPHFAVNGLLLKHRTGSYPREQILAATPRQQHPIATRGTSVFPAQRRSTQ